MTHHGAALRLETGNDDLVRALYEGWRTAPLPPEDAALCDLAERLTVAPSTVTAGDVERLRRHGFDDRAIHDACAVISYFNFVNRLALGLGVELEPDWAWDGAPPIPRRHR